MLKRTPFKLKKSYTLKKTPLRIGNKYNLKKTELKKPENYELKKQNEKKKVAWEKARQIRLERDNHKCVVCKKPATEVHHIHLRSKRPDLLLNQNNLRSLCSKHHFHRGSEKYIEQCELLALVEGITVEELLKNAEQKDE